MAIAGSRSTPLLIPNTLLKQGSAKREHPPSRERRLVAERSRILMVASPGLEGGLVAVLRIHAKFHPLTQSSILTQQLQHTPLAGTAHP
jgi:hypothetical protein